MEFLIVPFGLFQIVGNLGADLDRQKPHIDFDGNFHRPFLCSDFWGLNGGAESDTLAGNIVPIEEQKHPDGTRPFGCNG